MTKESFYLNDEVVIHPQTVFEITLFHDVSYLEIVEDMVKFENKRYIESNKPEMLITDDKVKESVLFLQEYHNEVTENGSKTEQLTKELLEKLMGTSD